MNNQLTNKCKNCIDYNSKDKSCSIRYAVEQGKRTPLKRNPNQKGCQVFYYKY